MAACERGNMNAVDLVCKAGGLELMMFTSEVCAYMYVSICKCIYTYIHVKHTYPHRCIFIHMIFSPEVTTESTYASQYMHVYTCIYNTYIYVVTMNKQHDTCMH
jgi:hypothetical protein